MEEVTSRRVLPGSAFELQPVELCSPHSVRMLQRLCPAHTTGAALTPDLLNAVMPTPSSPHPCPFGISTLCPSSIIIYYFTIWAVYYGYTVTPTHPPVPLPRPPTLPTCPAAKVAPRGELPGGFAHPVPAHGVDPDGQQHLRANVVEHRVLVLEHHGGPASAHTRRAGRRHERLLQGVDHLA